MLQTYIPTPAPGTHSTLLCSEQDAQTKWEKQITADRRIPGRGFEHWSNRENRMTAYQTTQSCTWPMLEFMISEGQSKSRWADVLCWGESTCHGLHLYANWLHRLQSNDIQPWFLGRDTNTTFFHTPKTPASLLSLITASKAPTKQFHTQTVISHLYTNIWR